MTVSGIFKSLSKSTFMNKHVNKVISDDIYAARLLVCSNVLKDAVVYGFRYDKSRKNKEIPEEKRGFVAALDLASGVTTCVVQLALGFAISNRNMQKIVCNKLFGHLKGEVNSIAKKGFIAAAALIGSGVIGERIIVPLFATPMASYLKEKHSKKTPTENYYLNKYLELTARNLNFIKLEVPCQD
ncbi:MAG: hypothetical protein A2Y25_07240 [Candidatus Melainabacteria bacterium GWF2_37_15]|nr:MAG: hypothetical protein A2Y25_07240 [Candidatus Melainabacteria bacterium GWF2_37_15]